METEHIIETNAAAEPVSRTTIIREGEPEAHRSGVGGMLIGLLAVLILGAVAFFVFGRMGDAEVAKDNAVTEAAGAVGDAADNVSEAANQAGAAVEQTVDSVTQ